MTPDTHRPPDLIPLRFYLQTEGLTALAVATGVYAHSGFSWWLYAALFFVPDLLMLGYLVNRRAGAICYNVGHTYAAPALLILTSVFSGSTDPLAVGLIWYAHIGFDRMLGYGLKHDSGFKHTHFDNL